MSTTLSIPPDGALDFVSLGAVVHRLDPGIIPFLEKMRREMRKGHHRFFTRRYMGDTLCRSCGGSRLRPEVSLVRLGDCTLPDFLRLSIGDALEALPALAGAAVVMAVFAWRVLSWLNPVVGQRMRRPVHFYVVAISAMMAMAVATFSAHAGLALLLGGLLFVISDLAVARNRFVAPGFVNRAWGLPTYFAAQLLLAASVAAI